MIVCLCHAVSEATIRQLVGEGASAQHIREQTGAGSDCGCCAQTVETLASNSAEPCARRGGGSPCPGCPNVAS